jgi:hypothetical protein
VLPQLNQHDPSSFKGQKVVHITGWSCCQRELGEEGRPHHRSIVLSKRYDWPPLPVLQNDKFLTLALAISETLNLAMATRNRTLWSLKSLTLVGAQP